MPLAAEKGGKMPSKIEQLASAVEGLSEDGRDRLDARLKSGPSNTVSARMQRLVDEHTRLLRVGSISPANIKRRDEIAREMQALEELE